MPTNREPINSIGCNHNLTNVVANGHATNLPVGGVASLHHLQELRASGLSDETIIASGIHTEINVRRLAEILGRKSWSQKYGYGLVIPYYDSAGNVVQYRVKPDNPPEKNGRKQKYLGPTGQPSRIYFPLDVRRRIENGTVEIIISEGEKKALAATQSGFCCLSVPGVTCWHGKKSLRLSSDLDQICWYGRTVYIAFDSDAVENADVRSNECLLADRLAAR